MYRVEGSLYPLRDNWPRYDREFFHHMMPKSIDDDTFLTPVKWIKDWLELANISYETEWTDKGKKFFVFQRRVDAIRFSLEWL